MNLNQAIKKCTKSCESTQKKVLQETKSELKGLETEESKYQIPPLPE